jgi:hypothetical protein
VSPSGPLTHAAVPALFDNCSTRCQLGAVVVGDLRFPSWWIGIPDRTVRRGRPRAGPGCPLASAIEAPHHLLHSERRARSGVWFGPRDPHAILDPSAALPWAQWGQARQPRRAASAPGLYSGGSDRGRIRARPDNPIAPESAARYTRPARSGRLFHHKCPAGSTRQVVVPPTSD